MSRLSAVQSTVFPPRYVHFTAHSFFWRALTEFTDEERSLFLRFVCGKSRLPASPAAFAEHQFKLQVHPTHPRGRIGRADLGLCDLCDCEAGCFWAMLW
jgi:HECT-like ubiquitin-transferase